MKYRVLKAYAETLTGLEEYEILTALISKCNDLGIDDIETAVNSVIEATAIEETDTNLYKAMMEQAHILVAGASGSGKSVVINGFINEILNTYGLDCMLLLCDPKRVELSSYKKLPQTIAYSDSHNGMIEVLKRTLDIIENRYKMMQKRKLKKYDGIPAFVFIDEFADLMTTNKKQALPICQRIAQIGRAANVHLIVASQDTTKKTLDTVKNNLTCKVALKTATKQDSRNIIGVSGAETLPRYGKCILDTGIEQKIVTVPYVDDDTITATINRYANSHSLLTRLVNKCY